LQSNAKIVAFLQLSTLEPIFSVTWVVLILPLEINVLKEMTFNLTTTVGLHMPWLHVFDQAQTEMALTPA